MINSIRGTFLVVTFWNCVKQINYWAECSFVQKINCAAETSEKIAEFSPGDPVVRTTMSMGSMLRGRSVTRGVSRPPQPDRTHIVMPKMFMSGWQRNATSVLRLKTERPQKKNESHSSWFWLKSPSSFARTYRIIRRSPGLKPHRNRPLMPSWCCCNVH